jgi:hypothetical protein
LAVNQIDNRKRQTALTELIEKVISWLDGFITHAGNNQWRFDNETAFEAIY